MATLRLYFIPLSITSMILGPLAKDVTEQPPIVLCQWKNRTILPIVKKFQPSSLIWQKGALIRIQKGNYIGLPLDICKNK